MCCELLQGKDQAGGPEQTGLTLAGTAWDLEPSGIAPA